MPSSYSPSRWILNSERLLLRHKVLAAWPEERMDLGESLERTIPDLFGNLNSDNDEYTNADADRGIDPQ